MVRTKADAGGSSGGSRKAVGASAPRKALGGAGPSSDVGSPAGKGKYAGGNPVCARPTPDWQKGIGGFLAKKQKMSTDEKEKENTVPNDDIEVLESSSSTEESTKKGESSKEGESSKDDS